MSDNLKNFLKKHDVQIEAPPGEWSRLKSLVGDKKSDKFFGFLPRPLALGLATAGVVALAIMNFPNGSTPIMVRTSETPAALSDAEAADFLEESFAAFEDENDAEFEEIFEL